MLRRKPLRQRAKPKPTKAEAFRIVESKFGPCIACIVWAALGKMPRKHVMVGGDYHHPTSGGRRLGHRHGHCGCLWHHRGVVSEGWTHERMRKHFGPSLMDGSALYHETYGTDAELIEIQDRLVAAARSNTIGGYDHG